VHSVVGICARSEHCIRCDDAKRDNCESRSLVIPHPTNTDPGGNRECKRPAAEQWNHFSSLHDYYRLMECSLTPEFPKTGL
jgi:hypothetical protein